MKILHINTVAQGGSIPNYIRSIANHGLSRGIETYVAKGRRADMPDIVNLQIGNKLSTAIHGIGTRIFDRHGLYSRHATHKLISDIKRLGPGIIHLHNVHGYYLHYPTFFAWLRDSGMPVLWSLHDTWAFTGHCASISDAERTCTRWQTTCRDCPFLRDYPASFFLDRSAKNQEEKRKIFNSVPQLTLLPVSKWLDRNLELSMLNKIRRVVMPIDVETEIFQPMEVTRRPIILGVASNWNRLKGLDYFVALRRELPLDVEIRLIGDVFDDLPDGITSVGRVSNPGQLATEYSQAALFINPTYADNYPMTNREALSCGTRLLSRDVGGAVEDLIDIGLPVWKANTNEEMIRIVINMLPELRDIDALNIESRTTREKMVERFGGQPNLNRLFDIYKAVSRGEDLQ